MSGSYDRPGGRPPSQPPQPPAGYDPYDVPPTGPAGRPGPPPVPGEHAAHGHGHGWAEHPPMPPHAYLDPAQHGDHTQPQTTPSLRPTLEAEAKEGYSPPRSEKQSSQAKAPIVPAGSVTGRSLTLVISIMCFLACLTAGTVYLIRQSADAWLKDIASEVTVQVRPIEKADLDKTIKDVVQHLERQPGIASVRPLSLATATDLLEPWLGKGDVLKNLPVPRLIALELDRSQPPDIKAVKEKLEAEFKGVSLDDHRRWQNQIRTVTRSFAAGGLAILLLMAAATTAIIVSATKSSMASNREIVEVLHFVGATDRFIAREFEKHFLRLGIRAGLVGATFALLVFLTMPLMMELLGGSSVTIAEVNRLIGRGALDTAGYILLGIVVVVVSALCMITSRVGVYRILNNKA